MVLEAHFLPPLGSSAESWLSLLRQKAFCWCQWSCREKLFPGTLEWRPCLSVHTSLGNVPFLSFLEVLPRETRCSLAPPKPTCKHVAQCGACSLSLSFWEQVQPAGWGRPFFAETMAIVLMQYLYPAYVMKEWNSGGSVYSATYMFLSFSQINPMLYLYYVALGTPLHSREREIKSYKRNS